MCPTSPQTPHVLPRHSTSERGERPRDYKRGRQKRARRVAAGGTRHQGRRAWDQEARRRGKVGSAQDLSPEVSARPAEAAASATAAAVEDPSASAGEGAAGAVRAKRKSQARKQGRRRPLECTPLWRSDAEARSEGTRKTWGSFHSGFGASVCGRLRHLRLPWSLLLTVHLVTAYDSCSTPARASTSPGIGGGREREGVVWQRWTTPGRSRQSWQ